MTYWEQLLESIVCRNHFEYTEEEDSGILKSPRSMVWLVRGDIMLSISSMKDVVELYGGYIYCHK